MLEEVVNDTMFVVWERASRFEGRSKVSTLVAGIADLKGIKVLDRIKKTPDQLSEPLSDANNIEEKSI